jgi:hypothetical protein
MLMIDGLHAVPSGAQEALRDLVRAREDLRGDLMRARHRLGKLLLRYDVRYDGAGDNWTHRHRVEACVGEWKRLRAGAHHRWRSGRALGDHHL